ncbi:glycosyltransferase [soil metagenome]
MSDILISVVIPTYHRNDLLARCLERLAPGRQRLDAASYEVIVTDDGKNSTAEALVRETFPWVKWVQGPQRGPAANRNNGARHATAEWIAFLDDDCVASDDWLAAYRNAIDDKAVIYEGRTTCNAGCHPLWEEAPINLNGGNLWSCNIMVHRRVMQELNGFDEKFPSPAMEDIDFQQRALGAGLAIKFVAQAVVDHPPRPRKFWTSAGKAWESRALYMFKHHQRDHIRYWLPAHVAKVRLQQLGSTLFHRGILLASASAAIETLYVLRHAGEWERKYSDRYRSGDTL